MRKDAYKERLPLLFAVLFSALLLSNCGYRPEGIEAAQPLSDVPAAAALPEETAAPQGKTYTVTYRVNGAETTELVAEGECVHNAPEFLPEQNCAIVAWKNANGTKVDIRTAPVYADTVKSLGFAAHAPQYTEEYDLIADKQLSPGYLPERRTRAYEGAPKTTGAYQRLVQLGDMLVGLIRRSKGRDNKTLAAFAEAISKLISKFEF